jgi:hypothetical protein
VRDIRAAVYGYTPHLCDLWMEARPFGEEKIGKRLCDTLNSILFVSTVNSTSTPTAISVICKKLDGGQLIFLTSFTEVLAFYVLYKSLLNGRCSHNDPYYLSPSVF